MPQRQRTDDTDELPRIGPAGEAIGISPRMIRYLEEQGVIAAQRGPGPRGHRHYPPPELQLGRAASRAMEDGHPSATLRALRSLATQRVAEVRASGNALAWFELLALARAVELASRHDADQPLPPGPPQPPHHQRTKV